MSQSRWVHEFHQHTFQDAWKSLKVAVDTTELVDVSDLNAAMELARLKRLIKYVDGIVYALDPELVPKSIWANFYNQVVQVAHSVQEYKVRNNIANLIEANDSADNLLSFVRPWMVTPVEAIDVVKNAAISYTQSLAMQYQVFIKNAQEGLEAIRQDRTQAASRLKGIAGAAERIDKLSDEIFEGGEESLEERIKNAVEVSQSLHSEVVRLHSQLLVDQPEYKSLSTVVSEAGAQIAAYEKDLKNTVILTKSRAEDLGEYHKKIFGSVDEESGKEIPGLKGELEARVTQIDQYEVDQHARHDTLFKKIEDLLPGANSAGLASAYREMKMGFDKPIKNYTIYFYCSLTLLGFGSLLLWVESFSIWPPAITFVGVKPWEELLRSLLGRAAFFIPVVWLAIFSATRRSQYERLQQEYAHKESFASSYDSYKKELKELGEATSDLQKQLLDKAIIAVAFNASSTLDGKSHVEKPPTLKFLEGVDPEALKKWVEVLAPAKSGR